MGNLAYRVVVSFPAQAENVSKHVTDGDHADRFAFLKNGNMAVAATIHFVKDKGEFVAHLDGFRVGGHVIADGSIVVACRVIGDAGKQVAFAENAGQLVGIVDNEDGANILVQHDLDGLGDRGAGMEEDHRGGLENADRILNEAFFNPVLGHGDIE